MNLVTEKNISADAASYIRKAIEAGDPFEALRNEALANFERLGFPANKAEEYKHTPLTRLLDKNFSFGAANAAAAGVNLDTVFIPKVTGNVLVFINGQFSARDSQIDTIEGLTILPLSEAVKTHGATIIKHLGKVADHTTDGFAAFNTASWTDGVFVHVASNKNIEKPVLIHHI